MGGGGEWRKSHFMAKRGLVVSGMRREACGTRASDLGGLGLEPAPSGHGGRRCRHCISFSVL